jgi:hypothetical protein
MPEPAGKMPALPYDSECDFAFPVLRLFKKDMTSNNVAA